MNEPNPNPPSTEAPHDGRKTEEPWDAAILARLQSPPFSTMRQGGNADDKGPLDIADDAIAVALNAEEVALPDEYRDLDCGKVKDLLALDLSLWNIVDSTTPAARSFTHLLDRPSAATSSATVRGQLEKIVSSLVSDNLLTLEHAAMIEGMIVVKDRRMSWWQSIGAPGPVSRYDFHRVRTP